MKKKILSVILAICSIGIFSGCKNKKEDAVNLVNEYWQNIKAANLDSLDKFYDDADEITDAPAQYLDDYMAGMALSFSGIVDSTLLQSSIDKCIGSVLDKVDYTVGEAKADGDDITVNCTASMPDLNMNTQDGMNIIFKVTETSDYKELLEKFLQSKGLTMDNASAAYADNNDAMQKDLAIWLLNNYMDSFVDEMLKSMGTVQKSWDFKVEKSDGRWVIEEITELA